MSPQVPFKSKGQHLFTLLVFIRLYVVVAVIVDCDGLPGCCDFYWFFRGWRRLRKGCWSVYVEYDLLRTRVHLLWLWEFWIGISAWWLCWACWRNPTILFRSSIYRVIQEESALLWEMIVWVILSKKVHTNMGRILNGYGVMGIF